MLKLRKVLLLRISCYRFSHYKKNLIKMILKTVSVKSDTTLLQYKYTLKSKF